MSYILEAGHAAIHRAHVPDLGEIIAALEITEGLVPDATQSVLDL